MVRNNPSVLLSDKALQEAIDLQSAWLMDLINSGEIDVEDVSSNNHVVVTTGRDNNWTPRVTAILGNSMMNADVLRYPGGIARDSLGQQIFVADRGHHRIVVYSPASGRILRVFGDLGLEPEKFNNPTGLAVDVRGRLIVADKDNHRIQVLTLKGEFILGFGKQGAEAGQFYYPWDVATNGKCNIVVADSHNFRVQLFDANGTFLKIFSFRKSSPLSLPDHQPRFVAFNREGYVLVTTFNSPTVIMIDRYFAAMQVVSTVLSLADPSKKTQPPQGLAVDDEGNIILSNSQTHQIQILSRCGKFKWSFSTEHIDMLCPASITLMPNGRVAAVDFLNNRVVVF